MPALQVSLAQMHDFDSGAEAFLKDVVKQYSYIEVQLRNDDTVLKTKSAY